MRTPVLAAFGTVLANGTIWQAGSGNWSVRRNSVGVYYITFAPMLPRAPIVQLTPIAANNNTEVYLATYPTRETFGINGWATSSNLQTDQSFSFFAYI
jgi:hypothetical protein